MVLTSAAINKKIRNLKEELELVLEKESNSEVYVSVEGYDDVVPEYSFKETQAKVESISEQIRKLKHALNVMNTTRKLEHFDMTIDEALVYMAQLNKRMARLDTARRRLPKSRKVTSRYGESTSLVEYVVANYDIDEVDAYYKEMQDTVNQLQMDIDYINQTVGINVDL